MGRLFVVELEGSIYRCIYCHTHFATANDIIESGMGSRLAFRELVNVTVGEERPFHGLLTVCRNANVAKILCVGCGNFVGRKYGAKRNDFVIARCEMIVPVGGEEQEMQGSSESSGEEEEMQGSSESDEG